MEKFKKLLALIKEGVEYVPAMKAVGMTEAEVTPLLAEQAITPEQLSKQVAEAVMAKLAPAPAPAPAAPAAQGFTLEQMSAMMDQKLAALRPAAPAEPEPQRRFLHGEPGAGGPAAVGAPGAMEGKTLAYKRLHPHEKELVDMIMSGRGEMGGKILLKSNIDLSQAECEEIIEGRKLAGLSQRKFPTFGRKALDSTANDGADWIPTSLASALHVRMGEITSILDIFTKWVQQAPIDYYPLATTRPTFYHDTTITSPGTESSIRSDKTMLTARRLMANTDIQDDTSYDSIIALVPLVQQTLAEAAVNNVVDCILNGDRTSTHMDSDTETVATHHNRAWYGLRYLALAVAGLKQSFATGDLSLDNLALLDAIMGKYSSGDQKQYCRWIVGTKGEKTLLSASGLQTFNNAGAAMTLVTGKLPSYLGIPFAVESQNREDLNASGVYDGSTKTKGGVLLVNGKEWILSTYKEVEFEVARIAASCKNTIYTRMRKDFMPFETASATIPTVAIGYNYNA